MRSRQLTDLERAFVEEYVANGARNGTRAARAAGYGGGENGQAVAACRLLRNPRIQAAIREECVREDQTLLPFARRQMQYILANRKHPRHFEALKLFLGTQGFSSITRTESRQTVEHTVDENMVEKLKRLTAMGGIDPHKLIDATPVREEEA